MLTVFASAAPKWWIYDGRPLCAAHAEGLLGAALYRDPRPRGQDGFEVKPLSAEGCAAGRARWDVV